MQEHLSLSMTHFQELAMVAKLFIAPYVELLHSPFHLFTPRVPWKYTKPTPHLPQLRKGVPAGVDTWVVDGAPFPEVNGRLVSGALRH